MKSGSTDNIKKRSILHPQFPSGGGEMGKLIRSIDWSKNVLGDIEHWPLSLRTSVSICLHSRFPMLIWWGKDLVKIYNDAYRTILGSKHPAIGVKGRDVWPEIWPIINPMLQQVLYEGKATWSEDQRLLVTRNGYLEECYFTFSYSPIYDEEGNVGGVFTAVTETTDEVIGERQLTTLKDLGKHISGKKSEKKIYEGVKKTLKRNPEDFPFALIYRIQEEEWTARKIMTLGISPEHEAAPAEIRMADSSSWNIGAAAKNNKCVIVDEATKIFIDLPVGVWEESPHQSLIMPISQAGRKHPFAVIIIGINPHRRLDKKYIAFFKLLADQIGGEISNVLSYEDARNQAEALAEIDEAKTTFFSNISHEFRTPLTLILGPIEDIIFQNDIQLPQAYWENIGTCYRNARRLLKLVNMLLDFSRIEAGRMQARFRPIIISQFTADVASNFRSMIENVGLQFEVKCEHITAPVYLDKEMWEKIVLNLLSNAFRYTLRGKITLTLKQENNRVKLSVKDTGIGIPEKELPYIFERFHRVQNVKGRTYEGTGIGLALVHELVKLHHGEIAVHSTEGMGSEFIVELPTGREHLPQHQVSDETTEQQSSDYYTREVEFLSDNTKQMRLQEEVGLEQDSTSSGQLQKSARILIVDDNSDMLDYVSHILGQYYLIESSSNGLDALEQLKDKQPDLIISDVMMPNMNGLELLEVLRRDVKTARIPVVLLSALGNEDAKVKGYDTGADDYLAKPFSAKELLSRVRAQLKISETRNHYELQMRNIFSQAYVAICILRGPEHIIEFANEQILTYWDKTEEEAINKPALEVFPEIIGQGFKNILDDVFIKGKRFIAHEFPVDLVRNGRRETTYIHLVYEPLREEDGSISGIIAVANEITDLVLSKHSLQESEMQFRNLVMQSPIAMGIFKGRDMIIDLANEAMLKLWGKEGLDVSGKKQIDVVPELIDQKFPLLMREVFDTGVPYKEEGAFASLNSSKGPVGYYLNYSYTPLFEPDGKTVSGLIATVVDVTEQTEAKKEVEESENRYRQLIQGLPSPLYTCDAQGRILLYNRAAANLWGQEPELYKDMWCGSWKIFEPDGSPLPMDECPMATALKESRPMTGEIIIERPDGVRRYVQTSAQPIFDADGKLTGATNMLLDITEAKRNEQVLRESEERFRKMADTAPAMIWMTDTNRLTQFFNTAWLKFTGRTLDQEKGRGWEENFHPDDKKRCLKISSEAFEARKEYTMEYRLKRHDGLYRWIAENAAPRFTADNAFEGYIGSCMDITDRKNASREMEKQVELRTKELKKVNDELEKMNQELTAFAYISSHDLQEPLRKIQTFISRVVDLEANNLSKKGKDYFNRIQKASVRMQQLIEDLLAYSRTNTDERNLEPMDLNGLLEEIQDELQEKIEEKNVVIQSAVLPKVKVINFQFHQLFTNLISNAIKFSREGVDPVITVQAVVVTGDQLNVKGIDPDRSYHHISVSDNGIGFNQQYSGRIFELFQRLHGRTEYRGTGIGLAICKKIVENHGGVITANGEMGEGATFHIYLPVEAHTA